MSARKPMLPRVAAKLALPQFEMTK